MNKITTFFLFFFLSLNTLFAQNPLLDSLKNHYDSVKFSANKKVILVTKEEKLALFDKKGKQLSDYVYDKLESLEDNLFRLQKGDKFALLDSNAGFITDFEWESIGNMEKGLLTATKNGKRGIINSKDSIILPFDYDFIRYFQVLHGFICKKDKQYGFFSVNKEWLLPLAYDSIETTGLYLGLHGKVKDYPYLLVRKNKKYGLYDAQGNTIVPLLYDGIYQREVEEPIEVWLEEKTGYYSPKGENIVPVIFPKNNRYNGMFFQGKVNDTFYVFDKKKLLFKTTLYDYLYAYANNYIVIQQKDTVLENEIEQLEQDDYEEWEASTSSSNGVDNKGCKPQNKQKLKSGLINMQGEVLIPPIYDNFKWLDTSFIAISKQKKWAIFSTNGKQLTDFLYDGIVESIDNQFIVAKNKKEGVIDVKGNIIIPFEYIYLNNLAKNRWLFATQVNERLKNRYGEGKWGVINEQNQQVLPAIYDKIERVELRNYFITKDNKQGMIDSTGKIVIPCKYDKIEKEYNYYNASGLDGKKTIYNSQGKYLASDNKNNIYLKWDGIFLSKNKQFGVIDSMGKVLVPFKYDDYNEYSDFYFFYKNREISAVYTREFKLATEKDTANWENRSIIAYNQKIIEHLPYPKNTYYGDSLNGFFTVFRPKQEGLIRIQAPTKVEMYDKFEYECSDCQFVIVQKDKHQGLMNLDYEWLIPLQDSLSFSYWRGSSEEQLNTKTKVYVENENSAKIGVYDVEQKQFLFPILYDKIHSISNNDTLFVVKNDEKYALINHEARLIIPFRYSNIEKNEPFLLAYVNKKSFYLVNKAGKLLLSTKYNGFGDYYGYFIELKKGKKIYYFTPSLNFITHKYALDIFHNYGYENKKYFVVSDNKTKNLIGMIDSSGEMIIPIRYKKIEEILHSFLFRVEKDNKYGVYNEKGRLITPILYEEIEVIGKKYLCVSKDNKYSVYNFSGKMILPLLYDKIGDNPNEAIKVRQNNRWGMFDSTGKQFIPFEYENLSEMINGRIVAKKNDKCGLLSPDNEWLIPPTYEGLEISSNNFLIAKKDCAFALLNPEGKEISTFEYEAISPLYLQYEPWYSDYRNLKMTYKDLFWVMKEGKQGIMDKNGRLLLACIYDKIVPKMISKVGIMLKKDNLYGIINENKKFILPISFEEIEWKEEFGVFIVRQKGLYGIYDKMGNEMLAPTYYFIRKNKETNTLEGQIKIGDAILEIKLK